jgi:hypothetical protein
MRLLQSEKGHSFSASSSISAALVIPLFSDPTPQPSTTEFAGDRGNGANDCIEITIIYSPLSNCHLYINSPSFTMVTSLLRSVLGRSTVKSCIQPLPRNRIISRSYAMGRAIPELKDKSLFIQKAYVNGEWVDAKSGKTFEVHGSSPILT